MKTLLTFASILSLVAALSTAHAQTPATPQDNPSPATPPAKTVDQRTSAYKGPKVVQDSKDLGRKMVQKSKPTDMRVPPPVPAQKK